MSLRSVIAGLARKPAISGADIQQLFEPLADFERRLERLENPKAVKGPMRIEPEERVQPGGPARG